MATGGRRGVSLPAKGKLGSARTALGSWLLGLLLCVATLSIGARDGRLLNLDLRALLPGTIATEQAAVAFFTQNFERQLVLALPLQSAEALPKLVQEARRSPLFSTVLAPTDLFAGIRADLPWLLSPEDFALLQEMSAAEFLVESRGEALMGGRLGAAFTVSEDPLGTGNRFVDFMAEQFDGGDYLVVTLTLAEGPFQLSYQQAVVDWLAAQRASLPNLLASGVVLHAQHAAQNAQREVRLLATASVVLVVLLAWAVFRGLKPLLFVLAVVLSAVLLGLTAAYLLLGRVHLMTLVFSASVVGVAADYAYHFMVEGSTVRYRHGLTLALLSSTLAFAVLAVPSFPGLRQMAVLGAAGLLGGALTVFALRPLLHAPVPIALARLEPPGRGSLPQPMLLGLFVLLVVMLLIFVRFDDDVRRLSPSELGSNAAELWDPGLFVLVSGESTEHVLQTEEALLAQIWRGAIAERAFASALLEPSAARRAVIETWRSTLSDTALEEFLAEVSAAPKIAAPANPSVAQKDLLGLRHSTPSGVTSVVRLSGYDRERLDALLAQQPRARVVDPAGEISMVLGVYRELASYSLMAAWLIATLLLTARLRRAGVRVGVIAGLAVTCALLGAQLLGGALTLFHLLAGFLVLGLAIDYGVFLNGAQAKVSVATGLAATSTLATFGLLSLSATPVIASFGVVVLIGTAVAWALALLCFAPVEAD